MQKSTERIKKLLGNICAARKLARAEMLDGFDCSTLAGDLERGEHTLRQRLSELKSHNARIESAPNTESATAAPQS